MQRLRTFPATATTLPGVLKMALWPLVVLTVLHRVVILAPQGSRTNDFGPVWEAARAFIERRAVYTADFNSVEPHYLYPPSGSLLMSPLGLINYEWSRWLFIGVNTAAVIIAALLLLRLFGYGLSSAAAPALLLALFFSESVSNTLVFTNVNGVILLLQVLFIALLIARKDLWAGVPIGLAVAIKPVLAPLLLLPLLQGRWRPLVASIGIPAVLTALAWPIAADPMDYIRRTVPYLTETRDYFNSSISGVGLYYGVPDWLTWIIRLGVAAMVLVIIYLLWRYYRDDPLMYLGTGSGVLLAGSFLLGSLGQQYYSMLLLPLLITVLLPNSVMRNWPVWVAVYLFASFDSWYSTRFKLTGETLQYLRGTVGWTLLIVVVFTVLLNRYLVARAEGRLDEGIDPPELRRVPTAAAGSTVES